MKYKISASADFYRSTPKLYSVQNLREQIFLSLYNVMFMWSFQKFQ